MNYSNQPELVALLAEIDYRLSKQWPGRKITIHIFGGAAAVIGYGTPRSTIDLDVYLEDQEIQKQILKWAAQGSQLEKKYGLYVQGANTTFMPIEDPQWRQRSVEVLRERFRCLRVMVLGKEDLVLSKLGRYNDRDRADIEYLLKTFKIDPGKFISYYTSVRSYYAGNLQTLDTTFNVVLREYFNLGPLKF